MPHAVSPDRGDESSALEPIAICGMACRLPGGVDSASSFWDMLVDKRDGQTPKVPKNRFNIDAHFHKNLDRPGSFNVAGGYFLDGNLEDFDPTAFNITPAEAQWLDPQQRKILEVAYECIESAGLPLEEIAGSNTAVFVGSFTSDYQQMSTKDPDFRHNYAATGVDPGIISNRIGNIFNLRGPSFTINTACSSSVYAIHNACHALRARDCDAALAGGVNLILTVDQHMNTAKLGILSPTSFCHTFDASADGYGRAEGAGCLYLKRLSDAIRDCDTVRGVIRSTAVNTNGKVDGMGITHPSVEGQERVVRLAYKRANLDMDKTAYAELHGTGTPVGDPIEVRAISRALNDTRSPNRPLLIGAVKPNIGHSEAASGIFAVMKAALMTENALVPGVARFQNLNPAIDESGWNVKVAANTQPWPAFSEIRRASVSSFGYGGTNGHVIVESVDSLHPWYQHGKKKAEAAYDHSTQKPHLLCMSAHDKATLQGNYAAIGKVANDYYLADLAYTLNARRSKLAQRGFVITDEASLSEAPLTESLQLGTALKNMPDVGMIFTGQGAQWAEMGRKALLQFPSMQRTIENLDEVLMRLSPPPSFKLMDIFTENEGVYIDINDAKVSQPACTAIQIAIVDLLTSWDIASKVSVGHSSGEIAAAYAAGLMSAPEAILASYCRGEAVVKSGASGSMLAVGLGVHEVQKYVQGDGQTEAVYIACENSPKSVTLSGSQRAITAAKKRMEADKVFVRELKTGRPYHSPYMKPVGQQYLALLARAVKVLRPSDYSWRLNRSNMVSSVTGKLIESSKLTADSDYWSQNLRNRVRFTEAVTTMGQLDDLKSVRIVIEVGPHKALAGPFKQICLSEKYDQYTYIPSLVRDADDVIQLLSVAGSLFNYGYPVDLEAVNSQSRTPTSATKTPFAGKTKSPSVLVDLPPYQWNYAKKYWAEPRYSAEQRALKHARHDILGSRVAGLSKRSSTWRNVLRQRDVPWLQDHALGGSAIFPMAGYMSMAIEAVRQIHDNDGVQVDGVTLRNIDVSAALPVPQDDNGIELQFRLQSPPADSQSKWHSFVVESVSDGVWETHCEGKIAVNYKAASIPEETRYPSDQARLTQRATGKNWYDAFHRVGFQYGPYFQQIKHVRSNRKLREAGAAIQVLERADGFEGESRYILHPSTVDSCLQLIIISIHAGAHKKMPWGVVPIKIEEASLWFPGTECGEVGDAIAWTDKVDGRHFNTHTELRTRSGALVMDIQSLECVSFEAAVPPSALAADASPQPYAMDVWKPDVTSFSTVAQSPSWASKMKTEVAWVSQLVELISHKRPLSQVLLLGNLTTPFIQAVVSSLASTTMVTAAGFTETEVKALTELCSSHPRVTIQQLSEDAAEWSGTLGSSADLILTSSLSSALNGTTRFIAPNLEAALVDQGFLLRVDEQTGPSQQVNGVHVQGLSSIFTTSTANASSGKSSKISLFTKRSEVFEDELINRRVTFLQAASSKNDHVFETALQSAFPRLKRKQIAMFDPVEDTHVIIDGTSDVDLATISPTTFTSLRHVLTSASSIMWVVRGAKQGRSTSSGMAEGFLRVTRSEHPASRVTFLDYDGETSSSVLAQVLAEKLAASPTKGSTEDTEFWIKENTLHICRVKANQSVNETLLTDSAANVGPLPRKVPLLLTNGSEGSVFKYDLDATNDKEFAAEEIEVQVEFSSVSDRPAIPYLITGSVINTASPQKKNLIGHKVAAFATQLNRTVVRTSVYQVLDAITDQRALLANLPLVCNDVNIALKVARVQQGENVLALPASRSRISALIAFSKIYKWNLIVATTSEEDSDYFIDKCKLSPDNLALVRDAGSVARVVSPSKEKAPAVIIASEFGDMSQEAWRSITTPVKFVLDGPLLGEAPAMKPFSRGASLMPTNTSALMESNTSAASDILALSMNLFRAYRGSLFAQAPQVVNIEQSHEKELLLSDNASMQPVLRYAYDESLVNIQSNKERLTLSSTATYLLVGCLGGLGRSLTTWMRERGAKHFAFLSRSGADKPEAAHVVNLLEQSGANVEVFRADSSKEKDVVNVVKKLQAQREIKGVIHAAMVLKDGMYEGLSYEDYYSSIAPKVLGARNLHEALKTTALDFFVMTSSISAVLGNPGQANYSAANSYLDYLARQRSVQGLAATSLALPMVLDVGVVAENDSIETSLSRKGMYGIDEEEMLRSFEVAMTSNPVKSAVPAASHIILGVETTELAKAVGSSDVTDVYWYDDARFSHIRKDIEERLKQSGASMAGSGFADTLKTAQAEGSDAVIAVITEHVAKKVGGILMLSYEDFELDGRSIGSYGLDSMIGAEMRTWLFKEFAMDIPFQALLAPTLTFKGLATDIAKQKQLVA